MLEAIDFVVDVVVVIVDVVVVAQLVVTGHITFSWVNKSDASEGLR